MRTALYILLAPLLALTAVTQDRVRSIHVFVALCDNEHQGIVPVPEKLGNGDDPNNNLYWSALYGTKTFLKKSKNWNVVATEKKPTEEILERTIFKHAATRTYLVADAYRGRKIRNAVEDFLNAAAGNDPKTLALGETKIRIAGGSDLVVYVGHNGLMDFSVEQTKQKKPGNAHDAIALACKSKPYFQPRLARLGCRAVLLTTGFMAPEAYTLEAAVEGWIAREDAEQIRERAARAYDKYQKCGLKAAGRLFYSEN